MTRRATSPPRELHLHIGRLSVDSALLGAASPQAFGAALSEALVQRLASDLPTPTPTPEATPGTVPCLAALVEAVAGQVRRARAQARDA